MNSSLTLGVGVLRSSRAAAAPHHFGAHPKASREANARSQPRPLGPRYVGAAATFTGRVLVTPLFQANAHARAAGASVAFEPRARSAWHSHPAGQTLPIVTAGSGWVQQWGGEKQEFRTGDVIWTPPGVKHWHGATAVEGMTHIAVQVGITSTARWSIGSEHVSDEQYGR